jgi:hypothetical protein
VLVAIDKNRSRRRALSGFRAFRRCTENRLGAGRGGRYNFSAEGREHKLNSLFPERPGEKWQMPALVRSFVCFVAVASAATAQLSSTPNLVTVRGKVLTLAQALEARHLGLKPDPDPIAKQVVLLADDGTIIPLLSDDASRALFLDERLRNGRSEIKGRRFAGVPYLQVVSFKVERDGRFQTPEYYCGVCAISVRYPQACSCCQGPMELRMRPEGR